VGNNVVSFVQAGLIYDTRDLEPDPSNGIFTELTNELSVKSLGSQYNFNKTFFHFNYYHNLFPSVFKKIIFAGRVGIGYTAGNSPFYEYQDEWSAEGSIEGLGGTNTIRGYKSSRFLSRVMQFSNFELRCRLLQFSKFKQHFAISAVPFFDVGGVWDSLDRITTHLNNMRYSEGLGIRIVWNVNTILRFDYAVSKEDNQFFFQIGHTF
jgi:outer membrane protein assembly factor BamA